MNAYSSNTRAYRSNTRAYRSELVKLGRRSTLLAAGAVLPFLALLATTLVILNAKDHPVIGRADGFEPSLAQLATSDGLTAGFRASTGFLGILVFVLFLTSFSSEYAQGTLRTLLIREPRRARLLLGKLAAVLSLVALSLLLAEVLSIGLSAVLVSSRGVSTSSWWTSAGLQQAGGDYGNALLAAALFGAIGTAVGVLVRSTSVGLAIGLAWLMPLEHIVQNAWADAERWFPGLLFDAVAAGGTSVTSYSRGLVMGTLLAGVLLAAGTASFLRRDVSG
ncbi:MAG: putative transporter integral rane protein [Frankiales bacterium]|nr:putative transporter integral rane protein [Frankiales bacterium]